MGRGRRMEDLIRQATDADRELGLREDAPVAKESDEHEPPKEAG